MDFWLVTLVIIDKVVISYWSLTTSELPRIYWFEARGMNLQRDGVALLRVLLKRTAYRNI